MHSLLASASLCDAVGEQHYVLQLEHLPHADAILAALSTGGFKFVQVAPAGLVQGQTFQFVERVTDVHARQSLGDPNLFQTSSLDGFVRTWDTRAGATPVESYSSQHGGPVHSCDGDALRVLGGVGDELYLWDRRTRKTIKHFPDTHFMDVVQVRWCGPNSFVSASEDGNVAVFDLSEVICEEDSFVGAVSVNSMRRMDLFGRENERLWCCSNTETLHWWDWRAACDEASTSGVDTAEALDAREQMGNAHYLIRCSQASDGSMLCFAGTAEGQVMAFGCHDQGGAIRFGTSPTSALVGGHQGVVRDVAVLGDGSVVVSCGEDGKINLWRAGDEGGGGSGGGSGGDAGRKTRYSPY